MILENRNAVFEFEGTKITATAKNPRTGELIPAGRLIYTMDSVVEAQTIFNGTHEDCQPIKSLFLEPISPETTFYTNVTARNLSNSESICDVSKEFISIGNGKFAEAVILNISWPADPAASLRFTFGLTNSTEPVPVRSYDASPNTKFNHLNYSYLPEQLKVTIELDNWTWQAPGRSYLTFLASVEHSLYLNNFSVPYPLEWELDPLKLAIRSQLGVEDGITTVTVVNDLSAVADGIAYVIGNEADMNVPGTLQAEPAVFDLVRKLWITIPFCSSQVDFAGYHFSSLWYDPSLAILFNTPNAPQAVSPEKQKRENKTAIIAGSVAAVVVVGITASLILAYTFSPKFKLWVRPFLARDQKAKVGSIQPDSGSSSNQTPSPTSPPQSNGWARSARPNAV